jgi:hypothetical protein
VGYRVNAVFRVMFNMLAIAVDVLIVALASPSADEEGAYRIANAPQLGGHPKSRERSVRGMTLGYCR